MNKCPNCFSDNVKATQRITCTGGGMPKDISELWHCYGCHDDFRIAVARPFIPFGDPIEEAFGEFKSVTETI